MDGHVFDRMARLWATTTDRRRTLCLIGAGEAMDQGIDGFLRHLDLDAVVRGTEEVSDGRHPRADIHALVGAVFHCF